MYFSHVTLTVKDLDASIRFYNEIVGLPIGRRFQAGPNAEIAFLGSGETKVELVCNKNQSDTIIGNGISMGFEVKNLQEKLDAMKNGSIPVISDIIQPNPHVRFFFIADPDGYRVQLLENI